MTQLDQSKKSAIEEFGDYLIEMFNRMQHDFLLSVVKSVDPFYCNSELDFTPFQLEQEPRRKYLDRYLNREGVALFNVKNSSVLVTSLSKIQQHQTNKTLVDTFINVFYDNGIEMSFYRNYPHSSFVKVFEELDLIDVLQNSALMNEMS